MKTCRRFQRGMSTLAVTTMVLAAVIVTVAFAHRGLLLEQKSAGNQYKAAQAFEAAEAGLEWAVAQLNDTTPLGDDCQASADAAALAFRERYLEAGLDGAWTPRTGIGQPTCARAGGGEWSCQCPADGAAAPPPAQESTASFSVQLLAADGPGVLRVIATGCSDGASRCTRSAAGAADAMARAQVLLARVPGLGSAPAAALTVRGAVSLPGAAFQLDHTGPSSGGMTLHAGGALDAPELKLTTVPGAPPAASAWAEDAQLAALSTDGLFASVFRMDKPTWKHQPGVRVIDCKAACDGPLAQATAGTVRQQLVWLDGGLKLDSALSLGTPERPVLLVVDGPVSLSAGLTLHGLIYTTDPAWHDAAAATVHGAVVFETALNGSGHTHIHHDASVLQALQRRTGTFARVPGSWRDF